MTLKVDNKLEESFIKDICDAVETGIRHEEYTASAESYYEENGRRHYMPINHVLLRGHVLNRYSDLATSINTLGKSKSPQDLLTLVIKLTEPEITIDEHFVKTNGNSINIINQLFDKHKDKIKYVTDLLKYIK